MKKVFLILLGLALLVSSIGVVSASDDTYIDSMNPGSYGDYTLNVINHGGSAATTSAATTISYEVGSNRYKVYIPPDFAFTNQMKTVVSRVNATGVVIGYGSSLVVDIQSKHLWALHPHDTAGNELDSDSEMPYVVSISPTQEGPDWTEIDRTSGPKRILTVPASTGTEPATDEIYLKFELTSTEATLNAVYKDTVTFSVGVITSP